MNNHAIYIPEDYNVYDLKRHEKIYYCMRTSAIIFFVSYIFYQSFILSIILSLFSFLYLPIVKKQLAQKRKKELSYQFREFLNSLQTSLNIGKSLEVAIYDVRRDLQLVYKQSDTPILLELIVIENKIRLNESFSDCMMDLARRTDVEDISNFSDAISICRKTGGNLIELVRNSSGIISDKLEIKQDIDVLLSKCRFETRILNIVPIGIILLLSTTAPDYIAPVFTTFLGRVAMTISIILLGISLVISNRIGDVSI